jgi:hypothetical protein
MKLVLLQALGRIRHCRRLRRGALGRRLARIAVSSREGILPESEAVRDLTVYRGKPSVTRSV